MGKKLMAIGLSAALAAAGAFAYNSCRKPDFLTEISDKVVRVESGRLTNMHFEDREAMMQNEYRSAYSDPRYAGAALLSGLFGGKSIGDYVLNDQIRGRWRDEGRSFILEARGADSSGEIDLSDGVPGGFIVPERDAKEKRWYVHVFMDREWKDPILFLGCRMMDTSVGKSKFKRAAGLRYYKASFNCREGHPIKALLREKEGDLPSFISTSESDITKEDWIEKGEYEEQQRMKNPEYRRKREMLAGLGQIRAAISIYQADNGKMPPSLGDLAPRYLSKIPEGDWEYSPNSRDYDVTSKSYPGY